MANGKIIKGAVSGGWLAVLLLLGTALGTQAETRHFKELLPFLEIQIPGWERTEKPSGVTVKQGQVQMSEARATFRAGDQTLEIILMDFWGKAMPFLAMGQVEMESSEETLRTTQVQGYPALESFRPQDRRGELNISVADRFWVRLEGEGLESPEALRAAAQRLDLPKLAALAR